MNEHALRFFIGALGLAFAAAAQAEVSPPLSAQTSAQTLAQQPGEASAPQSAPPSASPLAPATPDPVAPPAPPAAPSDRPSPTGVEPPPAPLRWERHAMPLPEGVWAVQALDADGDGRRDLVAVGHTRVWAMQGPRLRPYELFNAREGWMLHAAALDADGDGDVDLALARFDQPWIAHRAALAAGKPSTAPVGPDFTLAWIENPRAATRPWALHVIDRELNGVHGVAAGDMDGDGRTDLAAGSILGPGFADSLAWFRNRPGTAAAPASFERELVTRGGATGRVHYLDLADTDGDGHAEIVLAASTGGLLTMWRRSGQGWTGDVLIREPGVTNTLLRDLDGDGDLDVLASNGHGRGVFWLEMPSRARRVIDPLLPDGHCLAAADFDGDGDIDVATCSFSDRVVRWYQNDGRGSFTARDIDKPQPAYDLTAQDLDGDGRVDLLLAGRDRQNAVWYRNLPGDAKATDFDDFPLWPRKVPARPAAGDASQAPANQAAAAPAPADRFAQLSVRSPQATLPQAYALQDRVIRARAAEGLAGWKVGLASAESMRRAGTGQPLLAPLFASGRRHAQGHPVVELKDEPHTLIETELAFIIGRRIDRQVRSLAELRASVRAVAPAIELPGGAFEAGPPTAEDLVASGIVSRLYIVGAESRPSLLDDPARRVRLSRSGTPMHESPLAAAWEGQWETLLLAVNHAVGRGWALEPGQLVMTGALGPMHQAVPGVYEADYGELGRIAFTVR